MKIIMQPRVLSLDTVTHREQRSKSLQKSAKTCTQLIQEVQYEGVILTLLRKNNPKEEEKEDDKKEKKDDENIPDDEGDKDEKKKDDDNKADENAEK